MLHGEAEPVHAGAEEHRVAEREKPGVAEEHVVADGIGGQHQDAGEVALVVGGQRQAGEDQGGDERQVEGEGFRHRRAPVAVCVFGAR